MRKTHAKNTLSFYGLVLCTSLLLSLASIETAIGHVFPERSEPRVGHTISAPPSKVQVWFDGEIEPLFSSIIVEDAEKHRVDNGNGHVHSSDPTRLAVDLPPLPPGKYYVIWTAVAVDTHRTEGKFRFTIKP